MGVVCGKECGIGHVGGARRKGGKNKVVASNNWEKNFEVTMECYSVPVDRILTKDIDRLKKGLECRTVAVTVLHIDRRPDSTLPKMSKFTSVVYTPVIQWFGIDVREQVPKYLPMNLWPGSYTIFGFYAPDDHGPAYATITGKIGTEDIYLEEHLNSKKSLSAEQWSHISRCLEKELNRLPTKSTSQEEHRSMFEDTILVKEKTHRASEYTGYMTTGQSPYSIRNADQTSDSDDEISKDKASREKRLRLRRKDTPASNIHSQQISFLKDNIADLRETPLIEESNDQPTTDTSITQQTGTKTKLSVDSDNTTVLLTSKEVERSRSPLPTSLRPIVIHQDNTDVPINEDAPGTPKIKYDAEYPEAPKSPNSTKKKKKSLANKLGDMPAPSKPEVAEEPKVRRQNDLGSEADDECDSSTAESVKKLKEASISEDGNVAKNSSSSRSNRRQGSMSQDVAKEKEQGGDDTSEIKDKTDKLTTEETNDNLTTDGSEKYPEPRESSTPEKKTLVCLHETVDEVKTDKDSNKDSVDSQSFDIDTKQLDKTESSIKDTVKTKKHKEGDTVSIDMKTNQSAVSSSEVSKKDTASGKASSITGVKPKTRVPATVDRKSSLLKMKTSNIDKGKDSSYDRYATKNRSVSCASKSSYISKRRAQSIDNKGDRVVVSTSEVARPKEAFSDTN